MSESTGAGSWVTNALLIALAAAVAYVMVGLVRENRALKARIAELESSPVADALPAGAPVPAIELVASGGDREHLDELLANGGVVAFLSTTCPYCEQTLPTWSDLADRYGTRGVPFIGVSLDDRKATDAYVSDHDLGWPLWAPAGTGGVPGIVRVPYTVLVAPGGHVLESWLGVLSPSQADRLIAALDEELEGAETLVSGSLGRDPGCCAVPALGTGAGR